MYEAKVTRDNIAVAGKGVVDRSAKPGSVSSRQAVAGMFVERDPMLRG